MITIATDPVLVPFSRNRLLQGLTAAFGLAWIAAAVAPLNRFDWLLENALVFLGVGLLCAYYRTRPLSDLAYLLIAAFLLLHTVGAHYTYSKVPLGFWLQETLGQDRNHFDRIVHFSFGVLIVFPVREALFRYCDAGRGLSGFAAFTVIATASLFYETIEWAVAMIISPEAAMAFLGTQGDVFDAQKDSTLAVVGAVLGLALTRRGFAARNAV